MGTNTVLGQRCGPALLWGPKVTRTRASLRFPAAGPSLPEAPAGCRGRQVNPAALSRLVRAPSQILPQHLQSPRLPSRDEKMKRAAFSSRDGFQSRTLWSRAGKVSSLGRVSDDKEPLLWESHGSRATHCPLSWCFALCEQTSKKTAMQHFLHPNELLPNSSLMSCGKQQGSLVCFNLFNYSRS